jgi:FAD/FMN-containing dehydrogenase
MDPAIAQELDGIPFTADPAVLRARSRDWHTVSPLLRKALKGKTADAIVWPRDKAELARVVRAAVAHRVPLTARGGGTANYGQSVPLHGGLLVDVTQYDRVHAVGADHVRADGGVNLAVLDEALRARGRELMVHPSTKRHSTLAGFVAGGSGGVGSLANGMLRDPGAIRAIEIMTMEAEPRLIELRGEDVGLVHHAYGTNGLITEIEMPTRQTTAWTEALFAFPAFDAALDAAIALADEPAVDCKVGSLQEAPIGTILRPHADMVGEGETVVQTLIATADMDTARTLVTRHGGRTAFAAPETDGALGAPLYEYCYGHSLLQAQKADPAFTSLQGGYIADDVKTLIRAARAALAGEAPLRLELQRSGDSLAAIGGPLFRFESEAQMERLVALLQGAGVQVANSHTTSIAAVGVKQLTARDHAFRAETDPHGLLNPGKVELEDPEAFGSGLGAQGWSFEPVAAARPA